jgi:hypothetical protein
MTETGQLLDLHGYIYEKRYEEALHYLRQHPEEVEAKDSSGKTAFERLTETFISDELGLAGLILITEIANLPVAMDFEMESNDEKDQLHFGVVTNLTFLRGGDNSEDMMSVVEETYHDPERSQSGTRSFHSFHDDAMNTDLVNDEDLEDGHQRNGRNGVVVPGVDVLDAVQRQSRGNDVVNNDVANMDWDDDDSEDSNKENIPGNANGIARACTQSNE